MTRTNRLDPFINYFSISKTLETKNHRVDVGQSGENTGWWVRVLNGELSDWTQFKSIVSTDEAPVDGDSIMEYLSSLSVSQLSWAGGLCEFISSQNNLASICVSGAVMITSNYSALFSFKKHFDLTR